MRLALLFALAASCLLEGSAAAADWSASLSPKAPGRFPPHRPFKASYSFGWSAVTAGKAEAELSRKAGALVLVTKGQTVGAARALWQLDAEATSTVDARTLRPSELVQVERYSDEKRTTTVVFDAQGAARTRVREPKDKDSGKTKRFKFAPTYELHSALLFLRSQPMKTGEKVRLVVYPGSQPYLAEMEVLGREKLSVNGKKWPTIKVSLKLERINKKLQLERHKKFKKAVGWFSDDDDRLLLRIESEVMVGRVWMDLEKVEFIDEKR
jgi:hypothetical protein